MRTLMGEDQSLNTLKTSENVTIAIGITLAIFSALANGSFTAFSKIGSVQKAEVNPIIFNFWACIGIVLSSLLALFTSGFVWTPLGILSGLFFVTSAANSFRAVSLIGVSIGTGVWSGTAVLVSFVGGLIFDAEDEVESLLWSIIAIAIILIGIAGVAWAGHLGRMAAGQEENLHALLYSQESKGGNSGGTTFFTGVFCALGAGVLGGLIMLPMTVAGEDVQGVSFLPSFAIGVAIFAPIITLFPYATTIQQWPDFAPGAAALPGIVSGIVWNIGNTLSVLAIGYISYSVAYPVMQTGIFVAGLWGMFLFNEMSGSAGPVYWAAGVVVLFGVGLLTWAH